MLRPYLAVIRDSFRAAMSSRVLYIVLALIVIVLLALAPLHVRQTLDWKLSRESSMPAPDRLVKRLVDEGKSGSRAAVSSIWQKLSPELQADLEKDATRVASDNESDEERQPGPGGRSVHRKLINELNDLIENGDLYDKEAFKGKRLAEEAQTLVALGESRSVAENRRLNRLLLTSALRRDISAPGATQLDFYYFNWHWPTFTVNIPHSTFASGITTQLPVFFDKFVMSIGIFIAILVTASIIPEMLEPGSLNLLLSKPVHRWGLLLAKFVGGCAFIFLCGALFFTGIWLWMGIQLGVWERAILLSIPVYVLVFAMYYSISVLAGIWFRSPILCIAFAVLFWAVCFAIGYGYNLLDYRLYNTAPRQMIAVNDKAVMVDMLQRNQVWDGGSWVNTSNREISDEERGFEFATFFDRLDEFPDLPGPAVAVNPDAPGDGKDRLLVVDNGLLDALSNSGLKLASANPDDNWKTTARGKLPPGTIGIFFSSRFGQLVVDRSGGVFQWTGSEAPEETETTDNSESKSEENGKKESSGKSSGKSSGISRLLSRVSEKVEYERISGDDTWDLQSPSCVGLNATSDEIVFYTGKELVVLAPDADGKYSTRIQAKIGEHVNSTMTSFVGSGGSNIFLMLGNGQFYQIDSGDLSISGNEDLSDRGSPRCFSVSSDGSAVAIAFRSGELWTYDGKGQAVNLIAGIPKSDVLATAFDREGRLWVGDRFQAARLYDLTSGDEVREQEPASDWMTRAYRYIVRPLYRVFPKPGEFYKVVTHLSSSGDAKNNPDIDLTKQPHRDDPWLPLRSGLTFMAIMLAISCLVFQRQDF